MHRALVVVFVVLAAPATAGATIPFAAHPSAPRYGSQVTLSGTAAPDDVVELFFNGASTGQTAHADPTTGEFGFAFPAIQAGAYHVETPGDISDPVDLKLKPILTRRMAGLRFPGNRLVLKGRLRPASAGSLTLKVGARDWHVHIKHGGHYRAVLPTDRLGRHRARLVLRPRAGYRGFTVRKHYRILAPALSTGSRGTAVLALERRLAALRHIVRGGPNGYYAYDTYEAVLAFQKVHDLPRTGRADAHLWDVLEHSSRPQALYPGNHIEVDKTRQVLYLVRDGRVALVVHVSTGATGNTPIGTFHVYRKVPGFDWVLYYPMYFLRGFAIHGYPEVPAYPASHGCVRIPMWLAPRLFADNGYGTTIIVYY